MRTPGSLRLEQVPTELQVFVRRGDGANFQQQEVAVANGRLRVLAAGDWDYVLAMARFSSGSVMYAWRLKAPRVAEPNGGGEDAPILNEASFGLASFEHTAPVVSSFVSMAAGPPQSQSILFATRRTHSLERLAIVLPNGFDRALSASRGHERAGRPATF